MASLSIRNFTRQHGKLVWVGALAVTVLLTEGMMIRMSSGDAHYLTAQLRRGNITATVHATGTSHAKVALVSEQSSVQPGRDVRVGLHFQLEKDWHIYWINPGDSGEPPRVEWKLPPHFHAGPLEWPAPRRLENGPLVDYGYENEVLLTAAIRTPADLKPGRTAELQADIRWLACHDICIPGRQTVTLSLPVAGNAPGPHPEWAGLFARTREQMPRHAPAGWSVTAVSDPEAFVLSVKTGTSESHAIFFPLTPLQIQDSAPQHAIPFNQGIRLSLRKSDQLLQPPASLKGVLLLPQGKAYEIDAPVVSAKRPGKSSARRRPHR